jgi:hypothetical protein
MKKRAKLAVTFVAFIGGACHFQPMITDTGYKGTWSRGNARNVSIIAITEVDGTWKFRWTKRSFEGKLMILCDWDGRCEERLNGKLVATYAITTRFDSTSGLLHTDTVESRVFPDIQTFRYSDVMEVEDGGFTLWNYTVDRDGQHYEGVARPKRSFSKVADSVADPPRPARR